MNTRYEVVYVNGRQRFAHRELAERVVGHPLPRAVLHHRDENRKNNDPSNIIICQDAAYHGLIHYRTRAYRATGDAHWLKCVFCKAWGSPDGIVSGGTKWAYHRRCAANYERERRIRAS